MGNDHGSFQFPGNHIRKKSVNLVVFSLTCKKIIALMLTSIYISTANKFATLAHSQFLHFDSLTMLGDEVS